jgi:hypothetical protein
MDTKYNPLRRGRAFNEDTPIDFADITPEQEQEAADRISDMIEHTKGELGLENDN